MLINSPTIDYVTVCLPTSSGDIVSVVGGGATQALKNLSATFLNISTFNGSALSKPLQDAVNAAVQTI